MEMEEIERKIDSIKELYPEDLNGGYVNLIMENMDKNFIREVLDKIYYEGYENGHDDCESEIVDEIEDELVD